MKNIPSTFDLSFLRNDIAFTEINDTKEYCDFCLDVDECVDTCTGKSMKCSNLNGSFVCSCPSGYTFNYTTLLCEGDYLITA